MTVSLGGLGTLVFTGGVGERSPVIRAGVEARLRHLGVTIDDGLNRSATRGVDAEVSAASSPVAVLVVTAREDLEIVHGVKDLLGSAGDASVIDDEHLLG